MKRFLILYRQGDSDTAAAAVRDRLASRFGVRHVDMLSDDPQGVPEKIRRRASSIKTNYAAVLTLVGLRWVDSDHTGERRLDDPNDVVRHTLATALKAKEALVVPILVDGAEMPSAVDLPADVLALAYRNAASLRLGMTFSSDMEKVIRAIVTFLPLSQRPSYRGDTLLMLVSLMLGALGLLMKAAARGDPTQTALGMIIIYLCFIMLVVEWWIGLNRSIRLKTWCWILSFLLLGWTGAPMLLFDLFGPRELRKPPKSPSTTS